MNPEILKRLMALSEHLGMKVEMAKDMPKLFCGCQHPDAPVAVINLDQPQPEVIFTFLHELGHFVLHYKNPRPQNTHWLVNRPYENELMADIAYKTRRTLRQKFTKEWMADLWALSAFAVIGLPDDLKTFLKAHPEKCGLFCLVMMGHVKVRIGKFICKLFHL